MNECYIRPILKKGNSKLISFLVAMPTKNGRYFVFEITPLPKEALNINRKLAKCTFDACDLDKFLEAEVITTDDDSRIEVGVSVGYDEENELMRFIMTKALIILFDQGFSASVNIDAKEYKQLRNEFKFI